MPIYKTASFYCGKNKESLVRWNTIEGQEEPLRTILHAKIRTTALILQCGGNCSEDCDLLWLSQAKPNEIRERLKNQDR